MRRPKLWKEITVVLAVKVVLLAYLFFAFFGPSHRPLANTATVTARLLGTDNR